MIKERKNIMDINQKREYVLNDIRQDTLNGLKLEYASFIKHDDLYNFRMELQSHISKLEFGLEGLLKKLDEKQRQLKAHKEANGNHNIDVATASFQSLEVLANTLTKLENDVANFEYSIGIKQLRIQASKDFYLQVLGKPYLKYTSKNGPVRQMKFAEARDWSKKNSHLVEPVIEPDTNTVELDEKLWKQLDTEVALG